MNTLIHPHQLYVDQLQYEKSTAHIICHPFILSVRIFQGDFCFSWANQKAEAIANKYSQNQRVIILINSFILYVKHKYLHQCVTQHIMKEIENDLNQIIQMNCSQHPDFATFYFESL